MLQRLHENEKRNKVELYFYCTIQYILRGTKNDVLRKKTLRVVFIVVFRCSFQRQSFLLLVLKEYGRH